MIKIICTISVVLGLSCLSINTLNAQTEWVKYSANPVLAPGLAGAIDAQGFPFIYVMHNGANYQAWFTMSDGSHDRIGYATSTNGVEFSLNTEVFFEPTLGSTYFDSEGVFGACVLKVKDIYYMWYNGYKTQPYYAGNFLIGLATSTDGLNWTRVSNNPVLPLGDPGNWDEQWTYVNSVLWDEGVYKMWYTGMNSSGISSIGYATSSDGISWVKYSGNPVLKGSADKWDGANNQNARVIRVNDKYEMWFNGYASGTKEINIGYASSHDGIVWEKYSNNPVLVTGKVGTMDAEWCWSPVVIYLDGQYKMWYSGYSNDLYNVGYASDSVKTGLIPSEK